MPNIAVTDACVAPPRLLRMAVASAFLAACALCPVAAIVAAGALAPLPFVLSAFRQTEAAGR